MNPSRANYEASYATRNDSEKDEAESKPVVEDSTCDASREAYGYGICICIFGRWAREFSSFVVLSQVQVPSFPRYTGL